MTKEQMAMIVRTAVLFVALVNQLLMVFGYSILPISEEDISQLCSALLTVAASIWAWWHDNRWAG